MLRDFQRDLKNGIYTAWNDGAVNVMPVSPTGSGKTTVFSDILKEWSVPACVIAHRQELVAQASLALNRERVPHGIIAPQVIQRQIIALEMETFGYTHYAPDAPVRVAGVDTLRRRDGKERWFQQVQLVIQDEGHHVLQANKWGACMGLFPSARGLFPTAHAVRADGRGLGRTADGLVDRIVLAPSARELIDRGYLSDYRWVCPPSDINLKDVDVGASGDFVYEKLRAAVHKSKRIVGSVVRTYLEYASGKLGITFAVDVEAAGEIAAEYNRCGVPAHVITAETQIHIRGQLMKMFRARKILQLVNVDVLGEGVDVPAVEVVSLARPTASFQVYAQQCGRVSRIMVSDELNAQWGAFSDTERLDHIATSVKPKGMIIDHVGNWDRHGLPDVRQEYTLLRRERPARPKSSIPLKQCLGDGCFHPFPAYLLACPRCGWIPEPRPRGAPDAVDGDLYEVDPQVLRQLRTDADRIMLAPVVPRGLSTAANIAIVNTHRTRQEAQTLLRATMALWGGWQEHLGRNLREAHRLFYFCFGVDVLTAQSFNTVDALALNTRIRAELDRANVVERVA